MQIRVVSDRKEIPTLNPNERILHVAFRPSNTDIFGIVESCPKLEAIQLPISYKRTVAKSIEMFLKMQRIALIEGDVWGHRKDINEYRIIPTYALDEITNMKKCGYKPEAVAQKLEKQYKLSQDLLKFLYGKENLA